MSKIAYVLRCMTMHGQNRNINNLGGQPLWYPYTTFTLRGVKVTLQTLKSILWGGLHLNNLL